MTSDKFIDHVLKTNGYQFQAMICNEEMAELAKELSKYARGIGDREHVAEEIADVILCIREMCKVFDVDALEIEQRIKGKIDRYFEVEDKNAKVRKKAKR